MNAVASPVPDGARAARRSAILRAAALALLSGALAIGAVVLAGASGRPFDLTPGAQQSLSARTRAILSRTTAPLEIALVSPRATLDPRVRRMLDDLLDRFGAGAPSGAPITARWIDPSSDRGSRDFNALIARLADARSTVIDAHRAVVADAVAASRSLGASLASAATQAEAALQAGALPADAKETARRSPAMVRAIGRELESGAAEAERAGRVRIGALDLPSAEGARGALRPALRAGADSLAELASLLERAGAPRSAPATQSVANARDEALRIADRLDDAARTPLDLIGAADALASSSALLVASPQRTIPLRLGSLLRSDASGAGATEARFVGEEAIASAIGVLSNTRPPVVVLVHAAQTTLLDDQTSGRGSPATPEARQFFGRLIDRLRLRAGAVVEWPVGASPERPSLSQADPAGDRPVVWVLIPVAATVAEANARAALLAGAAKRLLDDGESVLVTLEPSALPRIGEADPLGALLTPWGIAPETGRPLFQSVATSRGPMVTPEFRLSPPDPPDDAHPIARAVGSLGLFLPWPSAMRLGAPADPAASVAPLLTIPSSAGAWGESQWLAFRATAREQRATLPEQPAPDPARDTIDTGGAGWVVGAAAERPRDPALPSGPSRTQRVVAVASSGWFFDPIAEESLVVDGRSTQANPGNAELFDAAICWLSHQDELIAASARATSIARVRQMPPRALEALRWAVILTPPALVGLVGLASRLLRR